MDQFSLKLKNIYILQSSVSDGIRQVPFAGTWRLIYLKKIFEKFFGLHYPIELIKITMITLFELINYNSTFITFFKQKSGKAQKTIDLIKHIKNRNDLSSGLTLDSLKSEIHILL